MKACVQQTDPTVTVHTITCPIIIELYTLCERNSRWCIRQVEIIRRLTDCTDVSRDTTHRTYGTPTHRTTCIHVFLCHTFIRSRQNWSIGLQFDFECIWTSIEQWCQDLGGRMSSCGDCVRTASYDVLTARWRTQFVSLDNIWSKMLLFRCVVYAYDKIHISKLREPGTVGKWGKRRNGVVGRE
jgi:hypothetical protein